MGHESDPLKRERVIEIRSLTEWLPLNDGTRDVLRALELAGATSVSVASRDPAGVRNAKRVAKERARKKAAKKHKQHMRRYGK